MQGIPRGENPSPQAFHAPPGARHGAPGGLRAGGDPRPAARAPCAFQVGNSFHAGPASSSTRPPPGAPRGASRLRARHRARGLRAALVQVGSTRVVNAAVALRVSKITTEIDATTSSTLSRNSGDSGLARVEIASHMGNRGHRFTGDSADRGFAAIPPVSSLTNSSTSPTSETSTMTNSSSTSSLKSPGHGLASGPTVGTASALLNVVEVAHRGDLEHRDLQLREDAPCSSLPAPQRHEQLKHHWPPANAATSRHRPPSSSDARLRSP